MIEVTNHACIHVLRSVCIALVLLSISLTCYIYIHEMEFVFVKFPAIFWISVPDYLNQTHLLKSVKHKKVKFVYMFNL